MLKQSTENEQCTMHKDFAWNRECMLLGAEQPGYVVSVFSDTSSVRVSPFSCHLRKISYQKSYGLLNPKFK